MSDNTDTWLHPEGGETWVRWDEKGGAWVARGHLRALLTEAGYEPREVPEHCNYMLYPETAETPPEWCFDLAVEGSDFCEYHLDEE